jgi:hypothetical protein
MGTLPFKAELLTELNFTSVTHFVDLAVKMWQSYYLKMALLGLKHVRVLQC